MKYSFFIIFSLILLSFSCQSEEGKPKNGPSEVKAMTGEKPASLDDKSTEDCDDKAKKVIEIKEETISLGGGDTGCSLDDL